jgi:myo-inositol-1(or 4)-monophosphatase
VNELDVALEAAHAAGRRLVEAHRTGPDHVDHKGAVDLVTEVDRACEAAVRAVLDRHTPDIPVLGEEEGGDFDAPTRWVVDPLDGTTNFVHGFPWFCVSVGLEVDGVREVGVVLDPLRPACFTARRGHGAHLDGRRLRVSDTRRLDAALVATGFAYDRRERARAYLSYVQAMIRHAQGIRRAGAAALDLAWLAAGRLDAYWEFNLKPWDVSAGALLVEEAGGRITDHAGGPLHGRFPAPLASNGHLHDAALGVLARVTEGLDPAERIRPPED